MPLHLHSAIRKQGQPFTLCTCCVAESKKHFKLSQFFCIDLLYIDSSKLKKQIAKNAFLKSQTGHRT